MAQPESKSRVAVAAIVLVVAALAVWLWLSRTAETVYDIPRTVRYTVTLHNPSNELVQNASFWVFAPVAQTAFQRVASIEATLPYKLESDALGNQRLLFTVDIPPYGTKNVSIDAHLELAIEPNRVDGSDQSQFLAAEDKIESDAEAIVQLAYRLQGKSETDTANSIYSWVSTSLQYAGYVKDDRGALYALNERRGDCTEYSYLYTALARSAGLPTRPMGGFVTADDAVLRARDFHNWAELYLDGKWRVVDPQYKQNRVQENQHIAMRILGAGGAGLTSTHQMVGADAGLDIRMN